MKKLLLVSVLLTLTAPIYAQSPQAPDKNPPIVGSPQVNLGYVQRSVVVAQPVYQQVVAQPIYQQRVVAVQQQCVAVQQHCVAQQFGFSNNFVGNGVSISAVDRRGTRVIANGANRVRVNRGLFGNIRSARAF